MNLLYDVAHNIAKLEEHTVDGKKKKVWVHRKGATRAFPPGHPEVPAAFRHDRPAGDHPRRHGPGAAGCWSAQPGSMEQTFGTTCHGAGRAMSRTAAVKDAAGRRIDKELEARGVIAMASEAGKGLAEEQPKAYKNVDDVVDVVHEAGPVAQGGPDAADRGDQGVAGEWERTAPLPLARPLRGRATLRFVVRECDLTRSFGLSRHPEYEARGRWPWRDTPSTSNPPTALRATLGAFLAVQGVRRNERRPMVRQLAERLEKSLNGQHHRSAFSGRRFLHHHSTAFIPHVVRATGRRGGRFNPTSTAFDGELGGLGPPNSAHRPARGRVPDGRVASRPSVAVWNGSALPGSMCRFPATPPAPSARADARSPCRFLRPANPNWASGRSTPTTVRPERGRTAAGTATRGTMHRGCTPRSSRSHRPIRHHCRGRFSNTAATRHSGSGTQKTRGTSRNDMITTLPPGRGRSARRIPYAAGNEGLR